MNILKDTYVMGMVWGVVLTIGIITVKTMIEELKDEEENY